MVFSTTLNFWLSHTLHFQRLPPKKLTAAKKTFAEMEMGFCQKASSPWSSPLHIVTKKDGTLHPCRNYRRLNVITEADHYPLPNITKVTTFLYGTKIFSKLDLLKGYFQVPINPEDRHHNALRHLHLQLLLLWPPQCRSYFSATDGWHPGRPSLLHRLHRRYFNFLCIKGGAPPTPASSSMGRKPPSPSPKTPSPMSPPSLSLHQVILYCCPQMSNPHQCIHLSLNYKQLAAKQQQDPELNICKTSLTSLQWHNVPLNDNTPTSILHDINTGCPHPWIPQALRHHVFDIIHGLARPLRLSTATLLKKHFIWHSTSKDAKSWGHECSSCQLSKIQHYTNSGVGSFHQPQCHFTHVHIHIVGPLLCSERHQYLLTMVDHSTRWPEAAPMTEASAVACASAILSSWVSRFGIPNHITSDRSTTFTLQPLQHPVASHNSLPSRIQWHVREVTLHLESSPARVHYTWRQTFGKHGKLPLHNNPP
ncbi:uncharacterized protein [Macrobrachium rosenbergii]|uniref:uncharacterized protein n=1 Tax=Macrobrachium rosenbergii TaxID=79674 RepID=UPI0034D67ACE